MIQERLNRIEYLLAEIVEKTLDAYNYVPQSDSDRQIVTWALTVYLSLDRIQAKRKRFG